MLVLVAMVGTISFAARYRPLGRGSVFGGNSAKFSDPYQYDDRGARIFVYQHGERFTYYFAIRNDGRFPVTVTGFPEDHDSGSLLVREDVRLSHYLDDRDCCVPYPSTPFAAFPLAPGQERMIVFAVRFANCDHFSQRSGQTRETVPVRFRAFGLTHTQRVELPTRIIVESPSDANCPLPRRAGG